MEAVGAASSLCHYVHVLTYWSFAENTKGESDRHPLSRNFLITVILLVEGWAPFDHVSEIVVCSYSNNCFNSWTSSGLLRMDPLGRGNQLLQQAQFISSEWNKRPGNGSHKASKYTVRDVMCASLASKPPVKKEKSLQLSTNCSSFLSLFLTNASGPSLQARIHPSWSITRKFSNYSELHRWPQLEQCLHFRISNRLWGSASRWKVAK